MARCLIFIRGGGGGGGGEEEEEEPTASTIASGLVGTSTALCWVGGEREEGSEGQVARGPAPGRDRVADASRALPPRPSSAIPRGRGARRIGWDASVELGGDC